MTSIILGKLGKVGDVFAVLGGWAIIVFSAAITLEVVLRKVAGISLQGLDEYGGYLLAVTSSLGFSYTLMQKSHIRVDVFLRVFSKKYRAILHVVASITLAFFASFIFYSSVSLLSSSWEFSARAVSPLQTPLIFPQSIWVFGLGLFAFASVIIGLVAVWRAVRGDWAGVDLIAGIASAEEEVQEEMKAAHERYATTDGKAV